MNFFKVILVLLVMTASFAKVECSGKGYNVKIEDSSEISISTPSGSLNVVRPKNHKMMANGHIEGNDDFRAFSVVISGERSSLMLVGKKYKRVDIHCSKK